MRKIPSILLKLGLSSLLLVGGLELTLRLMGYANGPSQYYDPQIGFRFFPDQQRYLLGPAQEKLADMVTNEMGYRGPWYGGAKPEGVQRVFCLGDSFTFGWGVNGEEAFPRELERLFGERARERSQPAPQVYNLGVPGYNTRNELNTYLHHARALEPDVVVLSYFQNDLQPDGGGPRYTDSFLFLLLGKTAIADAFHKHLRRKIPLFNAGRTPELKASMQYYKEHFDEIQDQPDSDAARPFWAESIGALRELVAAVRADGAELLFVIFPGSDQVRHARELLAQGGEAALGAAGAFPMQDELKRVAAGLELPCLDLMLPFTKSEANPYGTLDNTHPSAHGYRVSARLIATRLVELGFL